MTRTRIRAASVGVFALMVGTGCQNEAAKAPEQAPRTTSISVAVADATEVEVTEESVGYVESHTVPTVSAEVGGRVLDVTVDAGDTVSAGQVLARIDAEDYDAELRSQRGEVNRLTALIENQQRLVKRFRSLEEDAFVSQTALDDAESNLRALREQLHTARARLEIAGRNRARTEVLAPVDGRIQQRMVSAGSYVDKGAPLFQISALDRLTVYLPFPETVAARLHSGQEVQLTTPTSDTPVTGQITELRPMIGTTNRAVEAVVEVQNPGAWRPGASVAGRLVLERRPGVLVPDLSLVLRPAGNVVYVIEDDTARQRVVEVGERLGKQVEIRSGVEGGERVAADGAHFLSDGAPVRVRESEDDSA